MAEQSILIGARAALTTNTHILRIRELPCPGEVLVEIGDRLEPADLVARCTLKEQVVALDLARTLGLGLERVSRHVLVEPGEEVGPETLVASRERRLRPPIQVRAGVRGFVIGLREGTLFLTGASDWTQLRAYIPGDVSEIRPQRGVVMETTGSVVRGIWGAGHEGTGPLSIEAERPEGPIHWNRVTESHYGMVLAGGVLQSILTLRQAARYGIAGIIVGSLHPELRQACRQAPFPVVVTEGMGRIAMAAPIFEVLQAHDGNRVVLAGDSRLTASGPEMIIPQPPDAETSALETTALALRREPVVGSVVRLTGLTHMGAVGEVVSLPSEPQICGTGESVQGAWVRLTDRRLLFVPLNNIELLAPARPDPLALLR